MYSALVWKNKAEGLNIFLHGDILLTEGPGTLTGLRGSLSDKIGQHGIQGSLFRVGSTRWTTSDRQIGAGKRGMAGTVMGIFFFVGLKLHLDGWAMAWLIQPLSWSHEIPWEERGSHEELAIVPPT